MKNITFYKSVLNLESEEQVFDFLISNLKPSNTIWSYFVNWEKVLKNTKQIELALNALNYLIGKENFDDEFRFLIKENPSIAKVLPALVVRDGSNKKNFKILVDYQNKKLVYENFDFSKKEIKDEDIEKYLHFVKETGLKSLIVNKRLKNLVDYMIGVEAGLDSNARKNRGGHAMENIVEVFIKDVCEKCNYKYLKEANSEKIKKELGYDVPVDKSSRRYDFVIDNGKELFIIETNFYGGGGSKLKSTAGEYRNLFDVLNGQYKFFWITDGFGWQKTQKPLRENFDHNDYIFNLAMLEKGVLEFLTK
ncbi:type II restriction endonuclease [Candidatus Vampirococcus lugosii]|uniref:Type-2 restriction enzyme n=1 Tax=Candidatus Vampirococcus lugosii TaxID=2789015 RepID=A0ABS5QM40_9BACT|nr:type II restriction endonuclease [Candidatus Vampirococcus lugosii]MBS8122265.1 Restriction endonuclease, type II, DpmII-like [Candidatus Vampirococcus lugosii]